MSEIDKNSSYYKDIVKEEIIKGIDCSWFKDCVYYKQLEVLKAKYKNVLNLAKQNADSNEYCLQELEEQFDRLKQENEELKAKVKILDEMTGIFSARLMKKYKQALEEIKEIASGGADVNDCTFCYSIFEKCNEVLNEK